MCVSLRLGDGILELIDTFVSCVFAEGGEGDLQKTDIYAILSSRNPFHTLMAITTPPDACPIPDLPHPVPAIEKSGVDITQNPPIVRLEDVQESVEDKQAIERFRKNL